MADNYGIISDTQEPFGALKAVPFIKYVKKFFNVKDSCMYHVGDEADSFHGSTHPHGADYTMTPGQELKACRERLKEYYSAFPLMKLAVSNHGLRWVRKASDAEIPSEVLLDYKDLIEAPKGWQWADHWIVPAKHKFMVIHGMGYSGEAGTKNLVMDKRMSVVHGHLHSHAQIRYFNNGHSTLWGMNVGALIDEDAFAFKYSKWGRSKSCLGMGVVINNGTTPIWIPYET